jgi:hypothetical protein
MCDGLLLIEDLPPRCLMLSSFAAFSTANGA